MKVLFAVNNDNVTEAITKKYQSEYKEILSYKNVYYFNAIIRELQKDKSYSRIVISEDLEPFANNNYDSIDKFLFEKYSSIVEEAKSLNNDRIDIILICADRRKKTDGMLSKIYKKEIYNAIIGQDRSINEICKLINSPRDKDEARKYYSIQESELGQTESEDGVSEAEVENIIAHYARLGKNEDKYVETFNNIVVQYTDAQLKLIIKFLPMNVKAVLEEKSPKYQQLVTTSVLEGIDAKKKTENYKKIIKNKEKNKDNDDVVEQLINQRTIKSVVIPKNLKTENVQKVVVPKINRPEIQMQNIKVNKVKDVPEEELFIPTMDDEEIKKKLLEKDNEKEDIMEDIIPETQGEPQKRGRGRPRKNPIVVEEVEEQPKRGRGRPRKNPINVEEVENKPKRGRGRPRKERPEELSEDIIEPNLFELENAKQEEKSNEIKQENIPEESTEEIDLFDLENNAEPEVQEESEPEEVDLFNMEEDEEPEDEQEEQEIEESEEEEEEQQEDEEELDLFDIEETKPEEKEHEQEPNLFDIPEKNEKEQDNTSLAVQEPVFAQTNSGETSLNTVLTGDKKIVAFVGTTKNGTSFVVNNTAEMLASIGINTAILDLTKSKNSYYIYTNNEEKLRQIAKNCMKNLENGIAEGIKPHNNLSVYTEMPGEEEEYNLETVLTTLAKNHSAVLIDTDFETDYEVFNKVQELYLVQTMDVLTIQPLTAFLRNLKSKNILKQEKIRIVINKAEKVKNLSIKTLIGGMANYNAPSMSYMAELFDKSNVRYCEIPFDVQNYVKYLEAMVVCSINLRDYTKQLIMALRELANSVYPLISNQGNSSFMGKKDKNYKDPFSSQVNETLNKMKSQY